MIKEFLLTLLVLLAAIVYVRIKAGRVQSQPPRPSAQPLPTSRTPLLVAMGLVLFTLSISGAIYYSSWQAAHQIFTVQVTNTHTGEEQQFHVYRDDIRGRSFRTIDGREIHLSNAERMEVQVSEER